MRNPADILNNVFDSVINALKVAVTSFPALKADYTEQNPTGDSINAYLAQSKLIKPTITVSTDAYAAGDCIGGKIALTGAMRKSGGSGVLQNILIKDLSGTQKPFLKIQIFDSDPNTSIIQDQQPLSISLADTDKIISTILIDKADYHLLNSIYTQKKPVGDIVVANGSADLYMAISAVETPDFANTTDLKMVLGFFKD